MKVEINGAEYDFALRGFAPMYVYEVIMGEPFEGTCTRNIHVMIFATLLSSNPGKLKLTLAEFTEWLYDHPAEELAMAQEVSDEFNRRAELAIKKNE